MFLSHSQGFMLQGYKFAFDVILAVTAPTKSTSATLDFGERF